MLIPRHPSNRFFEQFTNAHLYDDTSQMVPMLLDALATEPVPMSQREQYMLSWEAATERLLDAAALPEGSPRVCERPESTAAYAAHYAMGFQPMFDGFRIATGAPPEEIDVTAQGKIVDAWEKQPVLLDRDTMMKLPPELRPAPAPAPA